MRRLSCFTAQPPPMHVASSAGVPAGPSSAPAILVSKVAHSQPGPPELTACSSTHNTSQLQFTHSSLARVNICQIVYWTTGAVM